MASNDRAEAPWFSLRGVRVHLQNAEVLHDVDFDIKRGELHVLAGKQGGGKSLLCNVLRGEAEPSGGHIAVDGKARPRFNRNVARKIGIESASFLPNIFPHLTVAENISIGLCRFPNRYWFGKRALYRKIDEWLEEQGVKGLPLESLMTKTPRHECLFIQVLACLFNRPRLLVLDETLENLLAHRRDQTLAMLRREMAAGMSVLWATHQLEDGWRLADRITIIRQGRILLTDSPNNIDRRGLLRLAYAQFPESEQDERDRERFFNLVLYTEALLKDLPLSIVIVDNGGAVQFVNRTARKSMPGVAADAGQPNLYDVLGDRNAGLAKALADAIRSGGGGDGHAVAFFSGAGERTVDYQVQAVRDGHVTIGAMLIMQDVSERERLRNRLILSHNVSSVGLLAAGVAHDVNNPLAVIGNYISYLLRKLPEGDIRDTAERIEAEVRNIQGIIDNLVAFSGNPRDDQDYLDLHALAVELCALLRFKAEKSGLELLVIPPPGDVRAVIVADVKEMRQLLINLIRNAMEAMPDGGSIRVDFSSCDAGGIVIHIVDNGPGIAFERPESIFEPFVSTKNDDDRYHGIGLAIVYSLVEKHNGSIAVENLPEGGCRFTLRFAMSE